MNKSNAVLSYSASRINNKHTTDANIIDEDRINMNPVNHGCKKPKAEVAVLLEKNSNRTENFGKDRKFYKIEKNRSNFLLDNL